MVDEPKKVRRRRVVRDKQGLPTPDPPLNKQLLGNLPEPDTEGKEYLEKEKTIAQVEVLLLKGVVVPYHIAKTLNISPHTAARYIEAVQTRWAVLGTPDRIRKIRGEAKARLDMITNELWVIFSNTDSQSMKAQCLGYLLQVHDRRMILDGVSNKTVGQDKDPSEGNLVDERIRNHQSMVKVANALIDYVQKAKGKVVPAEYTDAELVRNPGGDSGPVSTGQ